MKTKNIKTKRPWRRVKPIGYMKHESFIASSEPNMPEDEMTFDSVTQADFLREYYTSGHAINDPMAYPDIYREEIVPVLDDEGNDTGRTTRRIYKEAVPRYSFAFQKIISVKQLAHLCGNQIQAEINKQDPTDEDFSIFYRMRQGWAEKQMEVAFYESAKSVKITGDTAFVGYINHGVFGWKVLSYLDGSTLYPHYDAETGKMNLFARSFQDYDDEGSVMTEWLEVWDDHYLYRFQKAGEKYKGIVDKILDAFNMSGYKLVSKKSHGFNSIPVAYKRDEGGPCWTDSQDSIEGYEMSFSQMAHNNTAFGEPIMTLQGENVEAIHDINGSIKILTMGPDDKAGFLSGQSASDSYMKQLDTLYKMIYEESFAVIPPELRSGDLPAAALKILYSPAYEKAMADSKEYQSFLSKMVDIFTYGYGVESESSIDFKLLPLKWWIKPYVHVNTSALVQDLATCIQNGFLSKETATHRIEEYATVGEWDRIMTEYKEQQSADLLFQIKEKKINTPDDRKDGDQDKKKQQKQEPDKKDKE